MGKGLAEILADAVSDWYWTDERLGKYGEKLTERKLKLSSIFGRKGKILKNVYIPKENGETSEIDIIYITQKGIFVIESKNYSGWIFGDSKSQYWTSCLPNGDKNRFYSPIKQNAVHIKRLSEHMAGYTAANIPMFSIIVFSERCELKKTPEDTTDLIICKRDELNRKIKGLWEKLPDVLTELDIEITNDLLFELTNVTEAEKQAHVERIKRRTSKYVSNSAANEDIPVPNESTENTNTQHTGDVRICPRCGCQLVLRTARKGANAGNQFYGCSNFPKCRYIQNT